MNALLETAGVLCLAALGVALGRWFGSLNRPYWVLGYILPLSVVCLLALVRWVTVLELTPPFSWLVEGRREFALSALLGTMLLTTPSSKLPSRRDRRMVWLLMVLVVAQAAVLPFLAPAFNRRYLASLQTKIDENGICRQSNDYNCGPAAAVTALRMLGFEAEEGELAILAHTSQFTGTEPDVLRDALQQRYANEGLICEYRHFKTVEELRGAGLTLARIRFGLLVDHYVVVLQVGDSEMVVGDPFQGKRTLSKTEFAESWRFCGVVLGRKGSVPGPVRL